MAIDFIGLESQIDNIRRRLRARLGFSILYPENTGNAMRLATINFEGVGPTRVATVEEIQMWNLLVETLLEGRVKD